MSKTTPTRHLAENEVIFRERNERLQKSIEHLNDMADQHGQPDDAYQDDSNATLSFYCECSDEKCTERIPVKYEDYKAIHKNRKHFVVVKGHQVGSIESAIKEEAEYVVVQKNIELPTYTSDELNTTELSNAEASSS